MNTVVLCLAIVTLMPIFCSWISGYYRSSQPGGLDNKHPRLQAATLAGPGHRACAAQQNCWEALGMFTAALLAMHMASVALPAMATLCVVFVALRAAYVACYLANQDILRSTCFLGGLGICVYFFWTALHSGAVMH